MLLTEDLIGTEAEAFTVALFSEHQPTSAGCYRWSAEPQFVQLTRAF